jgi:hypothetical protein
MAQSNSWNFEAGLQRRRASRGLDAKPAEETQPDLDKQVGVLKVEVASVGQSVRRLAAKVDALPQKVAESVERQLERHIGSRETSRDDENREDMNNTEKIRGLETAVKDLQRLVEVGELLRARESKRILQLERKLEVSITRVQAGAKELGRVQQEMFVRAKQAFESTGVEVTEQAIRAAFLSLRMSVLEFVRSSAVQLGPLSDGPADDLDCFCPPRVWNGLSTRQRTCRVMARIFQLLFRRILRPSIHLVWPAAVPEK